MLIPMLLALRPELDRAALDAALGASNAPAVSAAIVKDGKTVWSGGKGATPDTVFRLASLTKAFTATVVLQLVNEGKVALDDPIGKPLPFLPQAWQSATVRQLLNHTSGIPSYTSLPDFEARLGERWTPAQIVARTADKPLNFPSGSKFEYDNTGYVILGMLVEKLDRRPFGDSLQRRILKPLGMSKTKLNAGSDKAEALGFDERGQPAIAINMSQPYAAGSIVSTANDMAKWLVAQGSERLLPQRLWNEAWAPTKIGDGKEPYGFGWEIGTINGTPTIEHGGGIPGFSTCVRRVPSRGLAVVVLTNAEGGKPSTVANRLLEAADPSLRPSDTAVSDPDPKVTEATQKLLIQIAQGVPDKSVLTPGLAAMLTPEAITGGQGLLGSLGKLEELRLVKIDGARRTYLARYEKGAIKVNAAMDAEGRFALFGMSPA